MYLMNKILFSLACMACLAATVHAQDYPEPNVVTPGCIQTQSAPSDAIILFDGKDLLAWTDDNNAPAKWKVNGDGTVTVVKSAGDILTQEAFENFQLHVEWCVPSCITGEGQSRGNSGIYLQDACEVQVLDSYQNATYANGQAASIYKQNRPLVNAMRPPGEWNVYDILYSAPVFREDGTYRIPPCVTVLHNGVLVQDRFNIRGTTPYVGFPEVVKHGPGPIRLQSHGDPSEPISFRNIWIRKL
jgi:hypothetical protein